VLLGDACDLVHHSLVDYDGPGPHIIARAKCHARFKANRDAVADTMPSPSKVVVAMCG
jgi:hypothetical protein